MDFFKSVFSEDPSPTSSDHNPDDSPPSPSSNSNTDSPQSQNPDDASPKFPSFGSSWTTFGSSLLRTVATKSESVIGNYRRDLEEFSSGLRKETGIIREAASRAVKDLPGTLESGAAVAQTSLESVGQVIDNLGGAVSDIIVHGKDSIFNANDVDSDDELVEPGSSDKQNLKPYNRLEAVIRTVQCDIRTYCEEPEEAGEYLEWKKEFVLEDLAGEIEDLVKENGAIGEIYNEVVPGKVDQETFWTRYFYRVYRVKKAEEARMKLVKRAIEGEEEEDLRWDVDDDEEGDESNKINAKEEMKKGVEESEKKVESLQLGSGDGASASKVRSEVGDDEQGVAEGRSEGNDSSGEKMESKLDDRGSSEGRNDNISDFSVVSSQPSEVDIGWDEIEDIGSSDEAKIPARSSPETVDLRRRLSVAADEEEDLPWDIEDDDDEPAKS